MNHGIKIHAVMISVVPRWIRVSMTVVHHKPNPDVTKSDDRVSTNNTKKRAIGQWINGVTMIKTEQINSGMTAIKTAMVKNGRKTSRKNRGGSRVKFHLRFFQDALRDPDTVSAETIQ